MFTNQLLHFLTHRDSRILRATSSLTGRASKLDPCRWCDSGAAVPQATLGGTAHDVAIFQLDASMILTADVAKIGVFGRGRAGGPRVGVDGADLGEGSRYKETIFRDGKSVFQHLSKIHHSVAAVRIIEMKAKKEEN